MGLTFALWYFASDTPSEDFVRLGLKLDIMDIGVRYEGFLMNNLEGTQYICLGTKPKTILKP